MSPYHAPVLIAEVLSFLNVEKGKRYIDATLGGGGHTQEIVRREASVLGIDVDSEAIAFASDHLAKKFGTEYIHKYVILVQGNYSDIYTIAHKYNYGSVDGILFDLGVSSHQLDEKSRGFSYRWDNSLVDCRMDQASGDPGYSVLGSLSEEDLYEIFALYGEEKHARAIAHAIVRTRFVNPIRTVGDLTRCINSVPMAGQKEVYARILQAIRIYVNREFFHLETGLKNAEKLVRPGGRIVVISFHSLEDRIVKMWMRKSGWTILTRSPVTVSREEWAQNSRSRSAKLRAVERPI